MNDDIISEVSRECALTHISLIQISAVIIALDNLNMIKEEYTLENIKNKFR